MNTHADKTQENKSQSVASGKSQLQSSGESTFQFVDNRPESVAQQKLQELANNSPQVKQVAQLQAMAGNHSTQQKQPVQKKENNAGLPDNLKTSMENLSGMSLDDVKMHHNSDKPAQLQAHAFAQGNDIHLASGQEKHLPHEAWHVVQQKQGRVKPTVQMKGYVNVNDDTSLEKEADVMGAKAMTTTNIALNETTTQRVTDKSSTQLPTSTSPVQSKAIDLSPGSPSTDVTQLALVFVNPQSGPVRLDAETFNGPDLYMWNQDQRAGEDPSDDIGSTNLFTDWAGAEDTTATFHRAHAYGKQFGGAGNESNVAWWAGASEDQWTPLEDRIRGDNNGGNAANWKPGVGEYGNYTVTRTVHPVMAIRACFRVPLISACTWGLQADRASFVALLLTLADNAKRDEADQARQTALGQVTAAVDALLNRINIDSASGLIINSMNINYTRTHTGANPGGSRNDINTTVNNTHTLNDFGLVNDDQQVWNALSTFGGMFSRGRQDLTRYLNVRLAAPQISQDESDRLRGEATAEAKAAKVATGSPPDYVPQQREIGPIFGQKMIAWRAANPQITLGPIADGWGRV